MPQEDRQHNHRDERKKSIQGVAGLSGFDVQAGGFDSLQSCRPFSSPCSARSSSWSAHAPRCTWRSSRSEHRVAVVHRSRRPRLGLTSADRVLCAWLSQAWSGWRSAVHIVKTETVSMAPARLSPVLEVEESTAQRAARCAPRRTRADPRAVHRQSASGVRRPRPWSSRASAGRVGRAPTVQRIGRHGISDRRWDGGGPCCERRCGRRGVRLQSASSFRCRQLPSIAPRKAGW